MSGSNPHKKELKARVIHMGYVRFQPPQEGAQGKGHTHGLCQVPTPTRRSSRQGSYTWAMSGSNPHKKELKARVIHMGYVRFQPPQEGAQGKGHTHGLCQVPTPTRRSSRQGSYTWAMSGSNPHKKELKARVIHMGYVRFQPPQEGAQGKGHTHGLCQVPTPTRRSSRQGSYTWAMSGSNPHKKELKARVIHMGYVRFQPPQEGAQGKGHTHSRKLQ